MLGGQPGKRRKDNLYTSFRHKKINGYSSRLNSKSVNRGRAFSKLKENLMTEPFRVQRRNRRYPDTTVWRKKERKKTFADHQLGERTGRGGGNWRATLFLRIAKRKKVVSSPAVQKKRREKGRGLKSNERQGDRTKAG